jgi:hypothetical protein
MNSRKIKGLNLLLLTGAILVGLVICEVVARFTYSAADIFPAHPQTDPVLGHRLLPFQSGHDSRGFRNEDAAGDFPVVCIGDSQVYGSGIPRKSAIPQQLGRIIQKRVYNMGLGGYGPVQYYQLLNQAKELHPQKIIIGFYLANDLLDAHFMADQYDHWKGLLPKAGSENQLDSISLCQIPYKPLDLDNLFAVPDIITLKLREGNSILWKVHSYLRLHSALYSLLYERVVKPPIQRFFERGKHLQQPGAFTCRQVDTIFTPGIMVNRLDLRDKKVRQGILVTQRIIELMARQYPKEVLLFVFIPTKEAVYYNYLKNEKVSIPPEYACSVYYEKEIAQWLSRAITAAGFQVIDVFPALEEAALQGRLLYHASSDAHLNTAGARIVASCLAKALEPKR